MGPIDIAEYDESTRENADEIYKKNLTEAVPVEYELEASAVLDSNDAEPSEEEKERAALLEATRRMVDESSQKVGEVIAGTEAIKSGVEEARQACQACEAAPTNPVVIVEQNGHSTTEVTDSVKKTVEVVSEEQVRIKEEREILDREQQVKMSRRKQWEAEDK